jgi:hypothetical protein
MISPVKEKIDYDGYYFIDAVAKDGYKMTIPARGYNLKSWINFEKSLGSTAEYRAVDEKTWMKTHWTQTPYEEVTPKAKKTPAKKAVVKKPAAKKAPGKKTTKAKK